MTRKDVDKRLSGSAGRSESFLFAYAIRYIFVRLTIAVRMCLES